MNINISLPVLIFIVLMILKLTHVLDIGWLMIVLWSLAPTLFFLLVAAILGLVCFLVVIVGKIHFKLKNKYL